MSPTSDQPQTGIRIDVISDVMCPWCYIGKRRLEKALGLVPDVRAEVHWRPFQLDPTLPAEGRDRAEYLAAKFGGLERAHEIYRNVIAAAESEGLDLRIDSIERSPNTIDAHRLIRWADEAGAQDEVVERLFQLYFVEGADLTRRTLYAEVAEEVGMDRARVEELYASGADVEEVRQEIGFAARIGVTGVPCFIFENRYAVMGAQDSESLAGVLRRITDEKRSQESRAGAA